MTGAIHDYRAKLSQPTVHRGVSQSARSLAHASDGEASPSLRWLFSDPQRGTRGPLSINLDLTVACNHRCTHCIDADLINTGHAFDFDDVVRSLTVLRVAGLRSVILIGGGEPTLHPEFRQTVDLIKLLGLQCAVVSNGSRVDRIEAVADRFSAGDWVRISLDAGRDETFQRMHRPRGRDLSLEAICSGAARIKRKNPAVTLGFSFIITWSGASVLDQPIADNVDEIVLATQLAKAHGFDYITFKPLLDRDETGGEKIDVPIGSLMRSARAPEGSAAAANAPASVTERISAALAAAKREQTATFSVVEAVNMQVLLEPASHADLTNQPARCYMHLYRQVVTPTGTYGCPVYRGAAYDRIGSSVAYASGASFLETRRQTARLIKEFDASRQCRNVHCLYSRTNWWLDEVAAGTATIVPTQTRRNDLFL